jgi:hypothetical protein
MKERGKHKEQEERKRQDDEEHCGFIDASAETKRTTRTHTRERKENTQWSTVSGTSE